MCKKLSILVLLAVMLAGCRKSPSRTWEDRAGDANLGADEFTQVVVEAIHAQMPHVKATILEPLVLNFEVSDAGGSLEAGEGTWYLNNAWKQCRNSPETRAEVIRQHLATIRSTMNVDQSDPMATANLVPIIKDTIWLQDAAKNGLQIPSIPLAADLHIVIANDDEPSGLRFLNQNSLQAMDESLAELLQVAVKNLRSRLPAIERHGDGPLYMLTSGGTFESSLLLLNEVWEQQQQVVDGRIVVAVPSRDLLLFTGERSADGIAEMRRIANDIQQTGNYLISPTVLMRQDGNWTALQP